LASGRRAVVLIALIWLAGCATGTADKQVQRAAEGPTAQEVFTSRFQDDYGRPPTYDESLKFEDELEERVSTYLGKHPGLSTSLNGTRLAFHPRVAVGMSKEQVAVVAGAPTESTQDEAQMEAAAGRFWPAVRQRAEEMWVYPGGWAFYFEGDRLVDLTVVGKPPL
jgi:hypothetical protein